MLVYLTLIVLAVATRLMPHAPNVAPIGALALFVGATALDAKTRSGKVAAYLVPLAALLVSDWIIGFYSWQIMASVYLGFALTVGIGLLVRRSYKWQTIAAGTLTGAIIFYLLTNAAVWAWSGMYPVTFAGLLESYTLALPFFRNSLIGDFLYTGVLFGTYELAKHPGIVKQWLEQHSSLAKKV